MYVCDFCGQHLAPDPGNWAFGVEPTVAELSTIPHGATKLVKATICVASGTRWLDICGVCLLRLLEDTSDAAAANAALAEGGARPFDDVRRELGLEP
jgi:hypothetical protein